MKRLNRYLAWTAVTLFTASLTACGGGGGGGTAPAGGNATPGVVRGEIEKLGSVVVNGVEFNISGATRTIDDNPGQPETEFKRGMIVTIKGTFDDRTGTATEIEVDDNLQGPISAVDPVNKTITVMGKTVQFEDNITRLNDDTAKVFGTTANFTVGQMVEVSGFDDSTGVIRASRIDDRTGATEVEAKGVVSGLAANSFTLTSGAATFTVNFTAALPAGVQNGSRVEVRGTLAGAVITALNSARGVSLEDDGIDDNMNKVEVEGIVASGNSSSFVINGITVTTSSTTTFENGLPSDLLPGVKVEAEGPRVNGVIQAIKVSFRSTVRIQGGITAKTGAGKVGTLTILGKTVATTANTDFRSFSGVAQTLDTLAAGTSRVEVRGVLDLNGNLVATRVDRVNDNDNKEFIMSQVTAKTATSVTLLFGNTVVTTNASTQFRVDNDDVNEVAISSTDFFNRVIPATATLPGTVVKARLSPGTLVAEELEIEGSH